MAYASIQMFMEKLKKLINCNDNPLINNPSIIRERPEFQLLYDKLGSMIQTLFIDQHQDLEQLDDLKKRFTDAAKEAEYIIDLFLSVVHVTNNGRLKEFKRKLDLDEVRRSLRCALYLFLLLIHIRNNAHLLTHEDFKPSLNLDDVRRSFKSIEVEFMSLKMERTLDQSSPAQILVTRNSSGSKKLLDEIFVGLDEDAKPIIEKLVAEYPKKVDVVSIVGMGGIGKTTLATKVFNDGYVKYHFDVRVWAMF